MHPPTSWNIFPHTTTSFHWNNITQAEDSLVPETAPEYLRPISLNQKKSLTWFRHSNWRCLSLSRFLSHFLSPITLWTHIAVFKVHFYLIRGLLLPIKNFKKTCCLDFGAGQGGAKVSWSLSRDLEFSDLLEDSLLKLPKAYWDTRVNSVPLLNLYHRESDTHYCRHAW